MITNVKANIRISEPEELPTNPFIDDYSTFWQDALKHNYPMLYNFQNSEFKLHVLWPKRNIVYNLANESDMPTLTLKIEIEEKAEKLKSIDSDICRLLVTHYLSQLFMIFNISAPGSFDCFRTKIKTSYNYDIEIKLSPTMWLQSILIFEKYSWPSIQIIPAIKTYDWLRKLELNLKQSASNKIERVLFALQNYSFEGNITPVNIIWLTLALEALYDVPSSSIIKTLRDRIFLTLGMPINNSKRIKKIIDSFYEIRSLIVHGHFNISPPVAIEYFDMSKLDQDEILMRNEEYAITILIATLQKMILNSALELSFSETVNFINKR